MLNNKGFAISTILYTLLIAFLLFLGATLQMFSASNSLVSNANNDLIDGSNFMAEQVTKPGVCSSGFEWYQDLSGGISNTIIKIKSRYGTMYWPKDFTDGNEVISYTISDSESLNSKNKNGNIKVEYEPASDGTDTYLFKLTFTDVLTEETKEVTVGNICP